MKKIRLSMVFSTISLLLVPVMACSTENSSFEEREPVIVTDSLMEYQYATIQTTMGDITLELHWEAAPQTVLNFAKLADSGYYDGIIFHRVIPQFMIQTGDPTGTGRGGESFEGGRFNDEINADALGLHEMKVSEGEAHYQRDMSMVLQRWVQEKNVTDPAERRKLVDRVIFQGNFNNALLIIVYKFIVQYIPFIKKYFSNAFFHV